jgi:hypothetical protein
MAGLKAALCPTSRRQPYFPRTVLYRCSKRMCSRTVALAVGAMIVLSACGHTLPDDPFDGEGTALSMVPINHTDRYAVNILVDKYWAGGVDDHAGGGKIICCYPGLKNWGQPVTIRWTWGQESDPKTGVVQKKREQRLAVAHFPANGPRNDPDPYKSDAYACVIFRDLNTVELAFSPSASGCADK